MRRTTTLTVLAALALTPLGLAAAPAVAAETCDGKVATIVVTPATDGHTTTPVTGTPGDDVVLGTADDDTIDGAGGNDTICGLAGADTLVGGDGDDRLFGGADSLYSADEGYYGDLLVPGAGDDLVDLGTGESDIWFWESDLEVDQVSYADSPNGVTVDLAAGTATGHGTDTIVDGAPGRPIGVIGSPYDDTLLGTPARDVVDGGAGDDTIVTGEGPDVVAPDSPGRTTSGWRLGDQSPVPEAQPGDDDVSTGAGSDGVHVARGADVVRAGADVDRLSSTSPEAGTRLLGGSGKDRFFLDEAAGTTVLGQSGNDQFRATIAAGATRWAFDGGAGSDRLVLDSPGRTRIDVLRVDIPRKRVDVDGSRAARLVRLERVSFWGKARRAVFTGGPRDDRFESTARSTRASGGGGNDRLTGGRGSDVLDGGPGRDVLNGSFGRDRCLRGERLQSCERRR